MNVKLALKTFHFFLKKVIFKLVSFLLWIFVILKISQQLRSFILTTSLFQIQAVPLSLQSSLGVNTRALILRQLSKDQTRKDAEGKVKFNKMVKGGKHTFRTTF